MLDCRDSLGTPIKKPTRIITNSMCVAAALGGHCDGFHQHAQTLGRSTELKQAEHYSEKFCKEIYDGVKQ